MSLLDDVSIVVTPNGYKAGELYAVVPVPTEGAEEVTDGNFPSGTTAWSFGTGWSLGTNKAERLVAASSSDLVQASVFSNLTSLFQISFDIEASAGTVRARLGQTNLSYVGQGSYVLYGVPTGNDQLKFQADSSFVGSITNVSVKEYTSADMDVTRATAATRVDENGLVNYAEVIGGEEIVDGDFLLTGTQAENTTGTYWITGSGTTISSGIADVTETGGVLQQAGGIFVSGNTFIIEFTISNYVSGSIAVSNVTPTTYRSANGTYTLTVIGAGGDFKFYSSSFVGSISNISVKEVTRDNVPRIDYTGGGCPHILAEPQRRNLCLRSQEIDNATWTKQAVTVSANSIASPDGNSNADSIVGDGTSGNHYILQSFTVVSSEDYTVSIFAKAGTNNFLQVILGAAPFGSSNYCNFDLLNGNIGSYGGTSFNRFIEPFGNGWYRLGFTATALSSGSANFFPTLITSSTSVFLESNTLDTSIEIYGCSLEEGSYATSYIPTSGSTVTRNQDIFSRDGIGSLINSTEGVLFVEMAALSNDITARTIGLSDGTTNNRVVLRYADTSNRVQGFIQVGGATNGNIFNTSYTITNFLKVAYKWKAGDFALWINGTEVATSTDATSFSAGVLTEIQFNEGDGAGNEFFGKVKQLQVYNTSLSDEQLLQLTGESGTDFYESYAEMASALTYTIQ